MPELPEVETIRRGISPSIINKSVIAVTVRQHNLRWPVPRDLAQNLSAQVVTGTSRRGKYLLIHFSNGTLIVHLGMSGRLLLLPKQHRIQLHEHVTIDFADGNSLCYVDPRRFGAILWTTGDPLQHKLLAELGPEPLSASFDVMYLCKQASRRRIFVKQFIMDSKVVVGVGNIYASEALFDARIHPERLTSKVRIPEYEVLVASIKQVLTEAIRRGGTTIRDYVTSDGHAGSFQNELKVYGRSGQRCYVCGSLIREVNLGQRSTFFCATCQK